VIETGEAEADHVLTHTIDLAAHSLIEMTTALDVHVLIEMTSVPDVHAMTETTIVPPDDRALMETVIVLPAFHDALNAMTTKVSEEAPAEPPVTTFPEDVLDPRTKVMTTSSVKTGLPVAPILTVAPLAKNSLANKRDILDGLVPM
jgi:hypothetical protein